MNTKICLIIGCALTVALPLSMAHATEVELPSVIEKMQNSKEIEQAKQDLLVRQEARRVRQAQKDLQAQIAESNRQFERINGSDNRGNAVSNASIPSSSNIIINANANGNTQQQNAAIEKGANSALKNGVNSVNGQVTTNGNAKQRPNLDINANTGNAELDQKLKELGDQIQEDQQELQDRERARGSSFSKSFM